MGQRVRMGLLSAAMALLATLHAAHAATVRIEVLTQILPFDPQAGMKSTQTLEIDFDKKKVSQSFKTGVTGLGPIQLASVRDQFLVENIDFSSPGRVGLTLKGQTASGVLFMPNINYKFFLAVTLSGGGSVSGCHDGYPAYQVKVSGKTVYDFRHESVNLVKLFGTCDIDLKKVIDF